jgi:hypothetical protein
MLFESTEQKLTFFIGYLFGLTSYGKTYLCFNGCVLLQDRVG